MMPPRQGSGGSQQRSAGVEEGFNITNHLREICENVAWSVPELSHIDVTQVAFAFAQARKAVMHGMQASLTPMRFKGGALTGDVRGRRMTVQRLYDQIEQTEGKAGYACRRRRERGARHRPGCKPAFL